MLARIIEHQNTMNKIIRDYEVERLRTWIKDIKWVLEDDVKDRLMVSRAEQGADMCDQALEGEDATGLFESPRTYEEYLAEKEAKAKVAEGKVRATPRGYHDVEGFYPDDDQDCIEHHCGEPLTDYEKKHTLYHLKEMLERSGLALISVESLKEIAKGAAQDSICMSERQHNIDICFRVAHIQVWDYHTAEEIARRIDGVMASKWFGDRL